MKHPFLAASLLFALPLATPSLSAQTRQFTAPAGKLTTPGYAWSGFFGFYLEGARVQNADPSMPKNKATLTRLDYRTGFGLQWGSATGMGRTFQSLSLDLGHTDNSKFTSSFAGNYKAAGTRVFAAKFSFPSLTAAPVPHQWGVLSFPFSKNFAYNGADDLLMDWNFGVGSLANGNTTARVANYAMEAVSWNWTRILGPESLYSPGSAWLPYDPFDRSKAQCLDSALSGSFSAYAYLEGELYADNHPATSLRGRASLSFSYTLGTAPDRNVVSVLSVGGTDQGIALPGVQCKKLHVDGAAVLAMVTQKAGSAATSARAPNAFSSAQILPYSSALAGVPFYFQGAWNDSKTGQLALTAASKLTLVKNENHPMASVYFSFVFAGQTFTVLEKNRVDRNFIERFTAK